MKSRKFATKSALSFFILTLFSSQFYHRILVSFAYRQFQLLHKHTAFSDCSYKSNRYNIGFMYPYELAGRQLFFYPFHSHAGDNWFCSAFQMNFKIIFKVYSLFLQYFYCFHGITAQTCTPRKQSVISSD